MKFTFFFVSRRTKSWQGDGKGLFAAVLITNAKSVFDVGREGTIMAFIHGMGLIN